MERECISVLPDNWDLIRAMIYPVLVICSRLPLVNPFCFSLVLLWSCLEFTRRNIRSRSLPGASGGWFSGGAAHSLRSTLDPRRHNRAARQKSEQLLQSIFGGSCKSQRTLWVWVCVFVCVWECMWVCVSFEDFVAQTDLSAGPFVTVPSLQHLLAPAQAAETNTCGPSWLYLIWDLQ